MIKRGGWEVDVNVGTGTETEVSAVEVWGVVAAGVIFGRLARGEFGRDGGAWLSRFAEGGVVDDSVMPCCFVEIEVIQLNVLCVFEFVG